MREKILGNRYDFILKLEKAEDEYCFEILSLYKKGERKSAITNVNFIISELVEPILNIELEDSFLFPRSKKKAEKLFSRSLSLFRDKLWVEDLEEHLDDDRSCGGWNSNFKF